MLSKNKIKFLQSLSLKKNRDETGLFIIEGEKSIQEVLQSPIKMKSIIGSEEIIMQYTSPQLEYLPATYAEIKKISSLQTPQGVLAVCEQPGKKPIFPHITDKLTLVLDDIQDPGNLGTIIRLCSWFGIENVVCSVNTVDCYNPKVVQSSMGSIAKVSVQYTNLQPFLNECRDQNLEIYGAFLDGKNIYAENLLNKGIIVMGNEGKGISPEIEKIITKKITIPNYSINNSGVESLNVSIATAIICGEFRRQLNG
jgi:TrmH family RNA methyltransferase